MAFDAHTGFLYMSAMSVLMALAIWIVLAGQRTPAVLYWCLGGFVSGAGSLLFALRGHLPELPIDLDIALVFLFTLLKIQSLRLEAGERAPWPRWALTLLGLVVAFELLRATPVGQLLGFDFAMLALGVLNLRLAHWAWRLWRRQGLHNALWIAGPYAFMGLMYVFRLLNVTLGHFEAAILTHGLDALLLALATLVASVATNMGYLGLHLDRSTRAKIDAAAAQARAEESQRLSEQLAALDRQRCLGAMSASLGHELNQPLAAILTHAQLAQRGLGEAPSDAPAPLREALDRIVLNTQRASQIIERIRGFIRPQAAQYAAVDLDRLVPEVTRLIAAEARAQRVTLILPPALPRVRVAGDPVQLSQILVNVLRNAIEALAQADRRELRLDLGAADRRAILRIQDSGPGLTPEALARVGEPFFSTKAGGLGMGLSISQDLAAQHGGTLTLTNAPGGGALAELTLPLLAPPLQPSHD